MRKFICILLCVLLAVPLAGCGKQADSAFYTDNNSINERVYAFYLSCYKQYWLDVLSQPDSRELWDTVQNGVTVEENLRALSDNAIKKRLVSAYLFDKLGLKISDAELISLQRTVSGIQASFSIEDDAVLKQLGVTEKDLLSALELDSKVAALRDYLYGENGDKKLTATEKEEFYQNNYIKFKHFYLCNYDYELDENGDLQYDEDSGYVKGKELTDERYEEKLAFAKDVCEQVKAGADMDPFIDAYSEEIGKENYKNGHYLSPASDYYDALAAAVRNMYTGEVKLIQTQIGIHVIQRVELDPYGWSKEENAPGGDFDNFNALCIENAFDEYTGSYFEIVKENKEITGKYKLGDMPYSESLNYLF